MSGKDPRGFYSVVNVQPTSEKANWIGDIAGAFVFTLALAHSEQHFKELVATEFHDDGFIVIDWGEIAPFDFSMDWNTENARILREHLCPEHPVQYARFDSYPREGLDA